MEFTKELQDFFINIQSNKKPTISIEIGSNEGTFSSRMKDICDKSKIWAFEANSYVFEKYKETHKDINFLNYAAYDKEEDLEFKIQKAFDYTNGNNGLFERRDGISYKINGFQHVEKDIQYETIIVKSIVIDNFFKDKISEDDTICMWIDVEGASKQVLEGCIETLKKTKSVFIEVEHEEFWKDQWLVSDVINFFNINGFTLLARDYQWYDDKPRQENFIFVNEKYLKNI